MILIDYEEYTNDYCRNFKQKQMMDLGEFADWIFGLCKGKYGDDIHIPDPDSKLLPEYMLPYMVEVQCKRTDGCEYWVHQIKQNGKIIFSDGKHTNGIKHWNDLMKQTCRDMLQRRDNPQFDFG